LSDGFVPSDSGVSVPPDGYLKARPTDGSPHAEELCAGPVLKHSAIQLPGCICKSFLRGEVSILCRIDLQMCFLSGKAPRNMEMKYDHIVFAPFLHTYSYFSQGATLPIKPPFGVDKRFFSGPSLCSTCLVSISATFRRPTKIMEQSTIPPAVLERAELVNAEQNMRAPRGVTFAVGITARCQYRFCTGISFMNSMSQNLSPLFI
jgi:hypothetical protein